MDISGKVAVVTGGASGIGRATALELARRGADVALADLHELRMEEVHREIDAMGRRCLYVRCDVAFDEQVDHLRDEVLEEFGRVDILMNNAGVALLGPPDTVPMQQWDWILQVNLYGVIRGVRAFVPHMLERGTGYVVNTSSVAGLYAYHWDTIPYITSKFAVAGLTEGLALYLRPLGVGVSVLCPGLVATNMGETARFAGVDDPARWVQPMPLSPAVAPEIVGGLVCDAIEDERYLVLTHPGEIRPRIAERGRDLDAFVAAQLASLPTPPNLHREG